MLGSLSCSYSSLCSGCDWLLKPYEEQKALKIQHFENAWSEKFKTEYSIPLIDCISTKAGASRDRVDLMIDRRSGRQKLGLFDRIKNGIVDLQGCPQLSAQLEDWLKEFRKIEFPIERGSVRLRVSPQGLRGVWLDFANADVKKLLDERKTLDHLRSLAIVEIGQKRKRLVERDGQLKLSDPVLEPWFETYTFHSKQKQGTYPLYCAIGSFTQPGFDVNQALVKEVSSHLAATQAKRAMEFGSGIGNFTLPLAAILDETHAYEVDTLALEGLQRSLQESGLEKKVVIHSGNFQIERREPPSFAGFDLIFVDPPRSGLMKFLDPLLSLEKNERPKDFVYVSCFTESFLTDFERLLNAGYKLKKLSLVDQFPQSRHYEIVASLHRTD